MSSARIRPNRLDLTDRFPMLGFTIRTEGGAPFAEVALATDPLLFTDKSRRSASNFYASREHGPLSAPRGDAVFVVPPEAIARFIGSEKLWFALATGPSRDGPFTVAALPTEASPYVSLSELTGRSLRRVRMFRTRPARGGGYDSGAPIEWAGDAARPGTKPANGVTAPAATPAPAPAVPGEPVPYDDGFGPMPPLVAEPITPTPANGGPIVATPLPPAPAAQALDGGAPVTVSTDLQPVAAPGARRLEAWEKMLIEGALAAVLPPPLNTLIPLARTAANTLGVSVGIGPCASIGLLQGGGIGGGIIIAPNNELGVYGQFELSAGLIASLGVALQVTVVRGGIEAFSGIGYAAGLSIGEGVTGGAAALFDANRAFQGITVQAGYGAGLSPVDIFVSTQRQVSVPLALARSRALSGFDPYAIEVKYRCFIPSPIIDAPGNNYGGDGRGFSYDQGTSRGELTATVHLTPGSGISSVDLIDRHWGESTEYDSDHTAHVAGKPDWWMEKIGNPTPVDRATLAVSDDNLSIQAGGGGMFRTNVATIEGASLVTIKAAGAMPLMITAPDIDADLSILLRNNGGLIEAKVLGEHDGFPAHEVYVNGIALHTYDPVAAGNGPNQLFPPMDQDVDTKWTVVARTYTVRIGTGQALDSGIPLDPGVGGMSIGSDALQIGDIILSTTSEIPSRLIRTGTGSAISHAMLYVGQGGQVIEAIGDGVVMRSLADAIGPASVAVAFRLPSLTEADRQLIADAAAPFIGLPYNYVGIVRQAAFIIDSAACSLLPEEAAVRCRQFVGKIDLGAAPADQFFCSQLVLEAYRQTGHALTNEEPHWASPEDIASLSMRSGVLAYVGHLKAPPLDRGFFGHLFGVQALAHRSPRSLDAESFTLNWDDVELVPQPTDISCWAAAGSMVVGWRDRVSLSPDTVAQICKGSTATVLDPARVGEFAAALGLVAEYPACYTVDGFRTLLENSGPLWVGSAVPTLHVIVVTGLYGSGDDVFVRISDPWDRAVGTPGSPGGYATTHSTGSRYIMRWEDFCAEYESAPSVMPSVNLQILHSGGTDGRTPNYGDARAAGYAQSLARAMSTPMVADLRFSERAWPVAPANALDHAAPDSLPTDQKRGYWQAQLRELVGNATAQKLDSLAAVALDRNWTIAVGAGSIEGVAVPSSIGSGLAIDGSGQPVTFGIGRLDGGASPTPFEPDAMAKVTDNRPQITILEGGREQLMRFGLGVQFRTPDNRVRRGAALLGPDGSFVGATFSLEANGLKAEDVFDAVKAGYALAPAQYGTFAQPLVRGLNAEIVPPVVPAPANGDVVCEFASYPGMKAPATMAAVGAPVPTTARIKLVDWPFIAAAGAVDGNPRTQAQLAIDFTHHAGSVGAVTISKLACQTAEGRRLRVVGTIAEAPDAGAVAALLVTLTHSFSRDGEPDQVAVTTVKLMGDGTNERRDAWTQATAPIAPAPIIAA